MKGIIAGVDVGGTAIKAALLDTDGNLICKTQESTPVTAGEDAVIAKISEIIKQLLAEEGVSKSALLGIGIGVPGPIDSATGTVYQAVNLGWVNTPLKAKMEKATGVPVYVDNDANNAALGEMWRGSGAGSTNLVVATIGTGVGGGIIINGEVVHGTNGLGGEIGHIAIEPFNGHLCNCGKTGCLETYTSATAIIREGTKAATEGSSPALADVCARNGKLTAKDVFDAAVNGDNGATAVVDKAAFYLGLGLSHIANALNPSKIVIGGGVSAAGEFFFSRIRQSFETYTWSFAANVSTIVPAVLGNDAGVIGAGWLVRSQLKE